jgi:hypothetical protein
VQRWKALAGGSLIITMTALSFSHAVSSSAAQRHRQHVAVTSFDDAKIIQICDESDPNESLGLSKPTVVDRIDGVDAVIFARPLRYSACIVYGGSDDAFNKPTSIRQIPFGVGELESFATLNKIPGRPLYKTNAWFVVRTSPTVSTIEALTRGATQASKVRDQFAFVHEKEVADVTGKFHYGVVAGFSSGGDLVGTGMLS